MNPSRRSRTFPERRAAGGVFAGLIFLMLALAAAAALAWMLFLPRLVEQAFYERTGCRLAIGSLYVNPFTGTVDARQVTVAAPPGFLAGDFLTVTRLTADIDPASLFGGRLIVRTAEVDAVSLTLTRNTAAALSLWRLLPTPAPATGAAAQTFLIRRLEIRLERLILADDTRGGVPRRTELDVRLDRTFTGVTDLRSLAGLFDALEQTPKT